MKQDTKAATAIEYGLFAALIALVLLTSTGTLADALNALLDMIESNTSDVAETAAG